ncbi:AAA family ATPase [[Ruminococcus] lactaris]|nr:AAA family ATPase [[Ruminococcus] lactaris]MDE8699286.1 AAA family ATPase [[Ruminococcus] lactaris]
MKTPEWLIPGYVPRYGITTLAGEGGTGKTSIICNIAAAVTTGRHPFLLDGKKIPFNGKPETVLFLSAEDSWEYVLGRRLMNNQANMELIKYLPTSDERFVDLNLNGELLKECIEQCRPGLVILDPIQSFIPENLRMGDRNSMRKCFTPLLGYAEVYKTTFMIVVHVNKQSGVYGRKRIADSSDIWDSSRAVLMLGETPEKGIRYLTQEKSNYGKLGETVLYTLSDENVPVYKSYTDKKDRDYVLAESRERNVAPALEDAKEFILDTLRENHKQMEVSELDDLAKACGISTNSLKNAKAALKREKMVHTWSVGNGYTSKKYLISLTATEKPNE